MAKFEWSETFLSIEGEGPYSGHPTAYIRFVKCNFECRGFNNPNNVEITNDVLGFDPANINSLNECPPIEIGCDSIYSWDKRFSHIWHKGTENDLAAAVMDLVPHHQWNHPVTNRPTLLSLTGGEPTLRMKTIPELLNHESFADLRYVLIETNCSVPLQVKHLTELNKWIHNGPRDEKGKPLRRIIWSNSPKLSVSGEDWDKAINPEVAAKQRIVNPENMEQYFKFVCDDSDEAFDEVERAMEAYWERGVPRDVPVYIMPMACTEEQQEDIAARVADKCLQRGYIYCHRIHNSVYANAIGK